MSIGQPATDEQASAVWIGGKHLRRGGRHHGQASVPVSASSPTTALHHAEPGWQGAVVRHRLTLFALFAFVITQQAKVHHQRGNGIAIELFPPAATQRFRQHHITKARAYQATYCKTNGFEHTMHLAVAPFCNRDAVPTIAALAAQELDHTELGRSVAKLHTIAKLLQRAFADFATHAYR